MVAKQGMRSVKTTEAKIVDDDALEAKTQKKIAKDIKKNREKDTEGLVLVSSEVDGPRFDFQLGVDETIRGVRVTGGRMMFVIPPDKVDRAKKHTWVVGGNLVIAD